MLNDSGVSPGEEGESYEDGGESFTYDSKKRTLSSFISKLAKFAFRFLVPFPPFPFPPFYFPSFLPLLTLLCLSC